MQSMPFRAMGCQMLAVMDTDDARATEALAQVPAWFEEWENILSRFRPDSELMRLNAAKGQSFHTSEVLWTVLQQALSAARASSGLVTPTVLDALTANGYDRTFDAVAGSDQSVKPTSIPDWRRIQVDASTRTVKLPPDLHLDFGGIAKGWAADESVRRLAPFGPALVDAGGDIAVSGRRALEQAWSIGIADPFEPDRDLAVVQLAGGAVATSGRDYRRWMRDGKMAHHIIDPRTGRPAETDVLAATVLAPSAVQAEIAAKAALILASRTGLEWIHARRDLAGLLVLENGQVVQSERMAEFLEHENVEYQY